MSVLPFSINSCNRRSGLALLLGAFLVLTLPACSTPHVRARQRSADFSSLTGNDQRLVLHGQIHAGMSPKAVFIAWGRPDSVIHGGDKNQQLEAWVYEQQITQYAPMASYEDRYISRVGSLGGYGVPGDGSIWFNSAGPYAGRSFYRSSVFTVAYRYRKAVFINGELKSYTDSGRVF